jgi:hypothetical protein
MLLLAVVPLENLLSSSSADVTSPPEYMPIMRVAADADKNHNGIEERKLPIF